MTSSSMIHFFLFSISLFSVSCLSVPHSPNSKSQAHPFLLPINKDPATNVFYTSIGIGTPQHNINVAIDLAGENLWYDCNNHYNSSSFLPINCESNTCPKNTHSCSFCQGQFRPGCTNNTCGTTNYNPLAQILFPGHLAEDVMFISQFQVFGALSGCTNSDVHSGFNGLLQKLPKSSKGIIGLARSQLALPTQLALLKKLPPKFSLCLPSSNNIGFTNLLIGPEEHPLNVSKNVKLQTTPLVFNPVDTGPEFEEGVTSTEHFIDVTSVKIDGQVVNLKHSLLSIQKNGNGGTRMSTMTRFTELQSFVYKPFVGDFLKKAAERRMKRVASVAPFEACFDVTTIGLAVPSIDLVLRGGAVWTIHGANSMVMVKQNVACLGFVDGGTIGTMSFVKASIVLGAHQLEENLLVFDLASNKFSFSSSLLLHNASCSSL